LNNPTVIIELSFEYAMVDKVYETKKINRKQKRVGIIQLTRKNTLLELPGNSFTSRN